MNVIMKDFNSDRTQGLGGSDIAAALGISPWKTKVDLFLEKTGQKKSDINPEFAYWGNVLEAPVAQRFAQQNQVKVSNVNKTFVHPEHDYMLANIDRAVGDQPAIQFGKWAATEILEVKTTSFFGGQNWGAESTDAIPEYYLTQAAWYLALTGCEVCHVAVLIGGNTYRQYKVENVSNLSNLLISKAEEFWLKHVVEKIPPEPVNENDVKSLYSASRSGKTIIADSTISVKMDRLRELKAAEKEITAETKAIKTDIQAYMADAETLVDQHGSILATWKTSKRNAFSASAFKKDHPDMHADYMRESSTRTFRIKGE